MKTKTKEALILWAITTVFLVVWIFAIASGIWWLWCQVVPHFWPQGPVTIVHPDYWYFTGLMFLVSWLFRALFGWNPKT
jgi:hypothetical protein